MTLQDYLNLTQNSINTFFSQLGPVLANLVAAVVLVVIGLIVGAILKRVWVEILKAINLEKSLNGWGSYQDLTKSHEDLTLTEFFGELLRWLGIIVFLIPAVSALGITGANEVLGRVLAYLPAVILASLFLILGFVISWFAHRVIMAIGVLVGENPAHLVANFAALAIIIFAIFQALLEVGIGLDIIRLIIIALLAASALAAGLAGKDSVAPVVKRFFDRASK